MNILKPIGLMATLAMTINATNAKASDVVRFNCPAGDIEYNVSMSGLLPAFVTVKASVGETMDQNMNREFALNMSNDTGGALAAYRGTDQYHGDLMFSASSPETVRLGFKDGTSVACTTNDNDEDPQKDLEAYVNSQIDMVERENSKTPIETLGLSLGGKVRSGPGGGYNKIAKIADGRDLIILSRSGVVENGFPWFEVQMPDGRKGYMRGSNICSATFKVEGTYGRCQDWDNMNVNNRPTTSLGQGWDWMAFAIDETGNVGHGVHPKRSTAGTLAIKNCGQGCRIVDEAQAKCHALYHSFENGYWTGIAYHENGAFAQNNAKKFCKKNAPKKSCKRAYSYCQRR